LRDGWHSLTLVVFGDHANIQYDRQSLPSQICKKEVPSLVPLFAISIWGAWFAFCAISMEIKSVHPPMDRYESASFFMFDRDI